MNLSFQRKSEHLANIPDARLHMMRQYTQCTGTVRIIAPSPNKGKWALGLLDKLELVNPFFQMKQTQFEDGFSCVGK